MEWKILLWLESAQIFESKFTQSFSERRLIERREKALYKIQLKDFRTLKWAQNFAALKTFWARAQGLEKIERERERERCQNFWAH